ncbi:hypothetical protein K439DRAFT_1014858 [Ramaria rubella]|nr:hypothetical protein K439DRAFT_1014858 [Ramaria rubella]
MRPRLHDVRPPGPPHPCTHWRVQPQVPSPAARPVVPRQPPGTACPAPPPRVPTPTPKSSFPCPPPSPHPHRVRQPPIPLPAPLHPAWACGRATVAATVAPRSTEGASMTAAAVVWARFRARMNANSPQATHHLPHSAETTPTSSHPPHTRPTSLPRRSPTLRTRATCSPTWA